MYRFTLWPLGGYYVLQRFGLISVFAYRRYHWRVGRDDCVLEYTYIRQDIMLRLMGDKEVYEATCTACTKHIGSVRSDGKITCLAFFYQLIRWPIEIAPPYIWAGVLVQKCLYLVKCGQSIIFITMFGITG